jgi:hypothetical protein
MQNSRFVVLTGHLDDYPLSDLVGILRHQKKTGRLLIEYSKGPAMFYFQAGELVDAQLNGLSGLQAICVALAQPAASFNFNPLIRPSRTSIESSLQRVVSELLGCWDESSLQIDSVATVRTLQNSECLPAATSDSRHGLPARTVETLALPAFVPQRLAFRENRNILVMAVAGLMMLGLSSVIAVTGGFKKAFESERPQSLPADSKDRLAPAIVAQPSSSTHQIELRKGPSGRGDISKGREVTSAFEPSHRHVGPVSTSKQNETGGSGPSRETASATKSPNSNERDTKFQDVIPKVESVNVVMKIENGRVLEASISNHKAGMDNYEALALRIARQRRYASKVTGEETVKVNVTQPN